MRNLAMLAKSPQGKKLVDKAQQIANDPKTKEQVDKAKLKFAEMRDSASSGGSSGGQGTSQTHKTDSSGGSKAA
jgi:hypothetical protein